MSGLFKTICAVPFAALISITAIAEEVTIPFDGLQLNGQLNMPVEGYESGPMVLIVHGTLAHNGMEIISSLQELLSDEDVNSLAINLSLGIDNRHGSYDCAAPHKHRHENAKREIAAWVEWLEGRGTEKILLVGHSRGGSQVASYSQNAANSAFAQVLIAPMTWSPDYAVDSYNHRYHQQLTNLVDSANQQQGEWMPDGTSFIYCDNAPKVSVASFLSYYQPAETLNTPDLLKNTALPTVLIAGSEDKVVKDLPAQMSKLDLPGVEFLVIDGADHYFRDLYGDEVVESMLELIERFQ